MNEPTFTPGPWHVEFFESEPDSPFVCMDAEPSDPVINEFSDIGGRQWANAQLASAAPDLLAFAQHFRRWHTGQMGFCNCTLCKEAAAAIAKATLPAEPTGQAGAASGEGLQG